MTEQDIKEQIEQLISLQSKFDPWKAAKVANKLQTEAFFLKAKIDEAEAEFDKCQELSLALTKQIQNLRKLQLQRKGTEVEPSLGELLATIGFKVDQKEISQAKEMLKALATHYSDTTKAIEKLSKPTPQPNTNPEYLQGKTQ